MTEYLLLDTWKKILFLTTYEVKLTTIKYVINHKFRRTLSRQTRRESLLIEVKRKIMHDIIDILGENKKKKKRKKFKIHDIVWQEVKDIEKLYMLTKCL